MQVTHRRPTPLLTDLRFDIERAETDRDLTCAARLFELVLFEADPDRRTAADGMAMGRALNVCR